MLLERFGPDLPRPFADTLNGSEYTNMKELRPTVNTVEWRVAYAFDANREAILLAAEPKGGNKRAMKQLLAKADKRFKAHVKKLKAAKAAKPKTGRRPK